ncbi:MAG TPA: phosphate ABC transporter permease subunit PstC [Candidatus Thermoplasmatota archaeon]|nr:phosphate ABC transporter permease subunit PstC [Candidatus Thermoplasmatota archaeon]
MASPPATAIPSMRLTRRETLRPFERALERGFEALMFACAAFAIVVTVGILWVLASNSWSFFREVSVVEFLTGRTWSPDIEPTSFGVLPLVNGTLMVTFGAAALAVPLGLATAIYLSEFAHARLRAVFKPAIELLAGIPSIVFGLFAVLVISPIVRGVFPDADVFNALNATIVLAFMILPIVTTLAEDALRAVPQELRAGALALGATRWEVTRQVVVPAALSGIVAGILLGISRAIGETMAVTLAAGATPRMTLDFTQSIQTMTAFITQRSQGDLVQAGPTFYSLFAVGLLLFVMTFAVNLLAHRIIRRYREVY